MKVRSTASLSVLLGIGLSLTAPAADDLGWRPLRVPPAVERSRQVVAQSQPAATLGRPIAVSLGRPEPIGGNEGADVSTAAYEAPPTVYRGQAPDAVPPPGGRGPISPPPPPPGINPYDSGVVAPATSNGNGWQQGWGHLKESFNRKCGKGLHSDLAGDLGQFASPVSSPFLTEDPRSLTELRPLFIYQSVPSSNPILKGGSIEFFGLQARLSLTERWSIVMNKLGGVAIQPDVQGPIVSDNSGFAEVWIGPKYTFYRDETNKTAAAVGLTFQIPTGSSKVFQNTGDLSLSPYITFAKGFGNLPQGFGNFNLMGTSGFSFSTENQRSDYFYGNLHLDYDVAGQHRLYPLIELNYTRYVNHGNARAITFEGGDLFNLGASQLSNKNELTLAVGARYKMGGRDCVQFGGAFEFPLTNQNNLNDFRFTFDVIFRY